MTRAGASWAMLSVLMICCTVSSSAFSLENRPDPDDETPYFVEYMAGHFAHFSHRGGGNNWPEHTLLAFEHAVVLAKTNVLEIDIRLTADGEIVIIHDATIDRTTNGSGAVADYTLAELKTFDAGYAYQEDGEYPYADMGLTIPTLLEFFEQVDAPNAFDGANPLINIELKEGGPAIEEQFVDLISAFDLQDRICLGSFDAAVTRRVSDALPGVCTYYPVGASICFALEALATGDIGACPRFDVLELPYDLLLSPLGESLIDEARDQGIPVVAWTANDRESIEALLQLGVDGIMTDDPLLLTAILEEE